MVIVRLGLDQNDVKISDAVWSEFLRLVDESRTGGDVVDNSAQENGVSFRVHEIGRPTGNGFGQTSAVDVDKDGDLDFISGRQFGDVFWFENQGADKWSQHLIGEKARTDVGGVAFDVDGDGWVDQVSGGTWFLAHNTQIRPMITGEISSGDGLWPFSTATRSLGLFRLNVGPRQNPSLPDHSISPWRLSCFLVVRGVAIGKRDISITEICLPRKLGCLPTSCRLERPFGFGLQHLKCPRFVGHNPA